MGEISLPYSKSLQFYFAYPITSWCKLPGANWGFHPPEFVLPSNIFFIYVVPLGLPFCHDLVPNSGVEVSVRDQSCIDSKNFQSLLCHPVCCFISLPSHVAWNLAKGYPIVLGSAVQWERTGWISRGDVLVLDEPLTAWRIGNLKRLSNSREQILLWQPMPVELLRVQQWILRLLWVGCSRLRPWTTPYPTTTSVFDQSV